MNNDTNNINDNPLATQEDANVLSLVPSSPDVPSTLPNPSNNININPTFVNDFLDTTQSVQGVRNTVNNAQKVTNDLRYYNQTTNN